MKSLGGRWAAELPPAILASGGRTGKSTSLIGREEYLGGISYSLYLIHGIVGWQVLSVGGDVFRVKTPKASAAWLALAIAASVAVAEVMRRWVELPSIVLARRPKR